jgi:hypothetical protein
MGLHAGNVAAFDKQAIGVSMVAIGARSKRYAMAADEADEAASGGFTDGERAGMHQDIPRQSRRRREVKRLIHAAIAALHRNVGFRSIPVVPRSVDGKKVPICMVRPCSQGGVLSGRT